MVFGPPSLGAFLQPVIKQFKLDEANGLAIDFAERTPDAYTAQFNSGEFQVGGSAAVLTVGLADARGVKVAYLFNLFDYWGAVVTSRPEVKTLKDLEGKDLAAARGTTNYIMFDWFARQQGVDLGKVAVVNTATPGLIGYALADRAAARAAVGAGLHDTDVEEAGTAHPRPRDRQALAGIRRQPQHSLSGRRGAYRLDRAAPRTGAEAVRDLQGRGRLAHGSSRRCGEAHRSEGIGG